MVYSLWENRKDFISIFVTVVGGGLQTVLNSVIIINRILASTLSFKSQLNCAYITYWISLRLKRILITIASCQANEFLFRWWNSRIYFKHNAIFYNRCIIIEKIWSCRCIPAKRPATKLDATAREPRISPLTSGPKTYKSGRRTDRLARWITSFPDQRDIERLNSQMNGCNVYFEMALSAF